MCLNFFLSQTEPMEKLQSTSCLVYIVNSLNFMLYPLWKSLPSCLPANNNTAKLAAAVADNINYLVFCQFLLDFFFFYWRIYTVLLN